MIWNLSKELDHLTTTTCAFRYAGEFKELHAVESIVGTMIGTCSRVVLPASGGPVPYHSSHSTSGDCAVRELSREFLGDRVRICYSVHRTSLWGLVLSHSLFSGARMMSGKGRTYPGGVTKWQWKRRQFKEDRKLELKRISRNKKLFTCRRREELKHAQPWISSSAISHDGSSADNEAVPFNKLITSVEDMALRVPTCAGIQGRQNSGISRVGWCASKESEFQQIQRVKALLSKKAVQCSPGHEELASTSFGKLQLSAPSLKALHTATARPSLARFLEATFPAILTGKDLIIRTAGGDDDIITSLLRGVEVASDTPRRMTISGRHSVHVLLVCPTREQVETARAEAGKLLMFHTGIFLQVVMSGSDIKQEMNRLRRCSCEILVATPGRLLANMRRSAELRGQLLGLEVLILHDVQMLLSMGYQKTIENIISLLPRTRQTIIWSKTLSDEVNTFSLYALKKDHAVINTLGGEKDTAPPVGKQECVLVPMRMHLPLIFRELKAHFEHDPRAKVVFFCQTVRTSTFLAALFKKLGLCTREIHIRKREDVRSRVAAEFRTSQEGMVLFTCGASVWGAGNPDVSLVCQVGSPSAREQYIRRVTPSGPTTKRRECLLILMHHERSFLEQLVDLSISERGDLRVGSDLELQVQRAVEGVDYQVRVKAYVAWLRYHVTKESTDTGKEKVLRLASEYASSLGFKNPPIISPKTVARLGVEKFFKSVSS